MLLIRFIGAFVSFVGFFTACQFAHPPKSLDSKADVATLELTVSTSDESDTDALVTKSDIDAVEGSSDQVQQKGSAPATLSVFRILATASGTVFGSAASIVFFVNLFFINIGTNVVEGLVRATFAEARVISLIFGQVFMFFKNDLGASSAVLGEFPSHVFRCYFEPIF